MIIRCGCSSLLNAPAELEGSLVRCFHCDCILWANAAANSIQPPPVIADSSPAKTAGRPTGVPAVIVATVAFAALAIGFALLGGSGYLAGTAHLSGRIAAMSPNRASPPAPQPQTVGPRPVSTTDPEPSLPFVSVDDLVSNPATYQSHPVRVTGRVFKLIEVSTSERRDFEVLLAPVHKTVAGLVRCRFFLDEDDGARMKQDSLVSISGTCLGADEDFADVVVVAKCEVYLAEYHSECQRLLDAANQALRAERFDAARQDFERACHLCADQPGSALYVKAMDGRERAEQLLDRQRRYETVLQLLDNQDYEAAISAGLALLEDDPNWEAAHNLVLRARYGREYHAAELARGRRDDAAAIDGFLRADQIVRDEKLDPIEPSAAAKLEEIGRMFIKRGEEAARGGQLSMADQAFRNAMKCRLRGLNVRRQLAQVLERRARQSVTESDFAAALAFATEIVADLEVNDERFNALRAELQFAVDQGEVLRFKVRTPPAVFLGFSARGDRVVALDSGGVLTVHDVKQRIQHTVYETGITNATAVAFASRNCRFAIANDSGGIRCLSLDSDLSNPSVCGPPIPLESVSSLALDDNGSMVAAGTSNAVAIWEADSGTPIFRGTQGAKVVVVSFSSDSQYLVSGTDTGSYKLWQPRAHGRKVIDNVVTAHPAPIDAACFMPHDRTRILTASRGVLRLWDYSIGKQADRLLGTMRVSQFLVGDHATFVVGQFSDEVRLLNVSGPEVEVVRALPAGREPFAQVSVAPNIEYLATANPRGEVQVWNVSTRSTAGK